MQREEGEEVGTEKMMMSMGSKRPQHLRERERENCFWLFFFTSRVQT